MVRLACFLLLLASVYCNDSKVNDVVDTKTGKTPEAKKKMNILIGPDGIARRMGPEEIRPPTGKNMNEACCDWAKNGQCLLNSKYMFLYCPESCGTVGANVNNWQTFSAQMVPKCLPILSRTTRVINDNTQQTNTPNRQWTANMPASKPEDFEDSPEDEILAKKTAQMAAAFGNPGFHNFGPFFGPPMAFGGFGNRFTSQPRSRPVNHQKNENSKENEAVEKAVESSAAGNKNQAASIATFANSNLGNIWGNNPMYRSSLAGLINGDGVDINHFLQRSQATPTTTWNNLGSTPFTGNWPAQLNTNWQPQANLGLWGTQNLGFNWANQLIPNANTEELMKKQAVSQVPQQTISPWSGGSWNQASLLGNPASLLGANNLPFMAGSSHFPAGTKFEWDGQRLVEINQAAADAAQKVTGVVKKNKST